MARDSLTSWLEKLPIRGRIALLVLGVMLPVAALVAAILSYDVSRAEVAAHEKAGALAAGTAADLQRVLHQFESVLARMSARARIKALDPADCDPLIEEFMLLNPASVGFAVVDGRGNIVCRYGSSPAVLPWTRDLAEGLAELPADGFRASNLFVDERSGRKLAALSYPVRDGAGAQRGLLVMTVDLPTLNEQLLASAPKGAVVTVVDRTQTVLLRSAAPETLIGKGPAAQEADPARGMRSGAFTADGRDGVRRLFDVVTLPDVGWQVAASLPEAEVFAGQRGAVWRTVGFAVGLCLFAFGLAWRMSVAIAGPIAHLQETAGQIAAGKDATRAMVTGPAEIRAVAEQFNQMFDARALSDARLRGIFESVVDAILTANEQQVIVQANPAAAGMLHCQLSDLVGEPLERFIPERFRQRYRDELQNLGSRPVDPRRRGLRRNATVLRADGVELPAEASVSHVSIAGLPLYTVILRDTTERRRAEQELREGASKLEAALSSMSDAVCIYDVRGRLIEFNLAFASFHGFADKADCSTTLAEYPEFLDMFMPDGNAAQPAQWPLSRALRGETASNCEYRLRRKETGKSWIGSYSFAPIRSEDGTIAGAVVAARDVTAIRAVQADLESSHFALQRFIASRDRVQEEERKRIARELHDDLQQTLAAIRMDLRFIGEQFGDAESRLPASVEVVDRLAEQAIASTRRIVNDLRPPMLEDLGLLPALELMASQFVQQTGVACTIDAASGISGELTEAPEVAICLYRIAQEALNNVVKHARASNVRILLATVPPSSIALRVIDDGVGMDQLDRHKPDSFGILGIQERVRSRGGFMRIDSMPGNGTTLEVQISVAAAPVVAREIGAMGAAYRRLHDAQRGALDDANTLPRLLSRTTHRALQDAIDALAGNVAILDPYGAIRFVNRAWIEFAKRNGSSQAESMGPGANYLDLCRQRALADIAGREIWRGLEALLHGYHTAFDCVYTAHSAGELRWFQMHASPMANGDVMVEHFLIRHERRANPQGAKGHAA